MDNAVDKAGPALRPASPDIPAKLRASTTLNACLVAVSCLQSNPTNSTDESFRWRQQPDYNENYYQSGLFNSSCQYRRLFFRRQRQILLSFIHSIRLDRHLGQRQLPNKDNRLWFLHPGIQRRYLPERLRRRSSMKSHLPTTHHVHDTNIHQQGAGAGPGCGTCWKLTIQKDSSGHTLSNAGNSIVVMVTNLCPASGNPLCSQSGLSGTNQYGANLNFDLCIDSKANSALFGNSGVGLGVGSAVQVDCSQWSGSIVR